MTATAYLNGEFLPLAEAKVSVLDRGFVFGDGVYEVVPVYSRRPFRLAEHLHRLGASLAAIRLPDPYDGARWAEVVTGVIAANGPEDQSVYLQVTRGVAPRDHAFPVGGTPTVFVMSSPLAPPPAAWLDDGVVAITVADVRWLRCDIKAVSLLPNVLARQAAVEAGAAEAVLLRDGFLTEGAASNIFVVLAGVIVAPPKSHLMLPGITYDVVLELAAAHGMAHEVRPVSEAELRGADEVWLTSSTREVLAVTRLDGRPVGAGRPGPLHARMRSAYQAFKAAARGSDA